MSPLLCIALLGQLPSPPLVPADDPTPRRAVAPSGPYQRLAPAPPLGVAVEPQPEEFRRLWELAGLGAALALGTWVASLYVFFDSIHCSLSLFSARCTSASGLLVLPQLGPWLAIVDNGPTDPWFGTNLGLGVAQLGGLAAMVLGMAVRVPVGEADVLVNVAPTGNGVALGGAF